MSWFTRDEDYDISIITTGDTEEQALQSMNEYSDQDLVHTGEATRINELDDGTYVANGFFKFR